MELWSELYSSAADGLWIAAMLFTGSLGVTVCVWIGERTISLLSLSDDDAQHVKGGLAIAGVLIYMLEVVTHLATGTLRHAMEQSIIALLRATVENIIVILMLGMVVWIGQRVLGTSQQQKKAPKPPKDNKDS